ncbi:MAG TPA: ATP-binding protein [Pseudonocardia sp.]
MRLGHGEVLRLRIADEQDVFLARQRGREVAALAGLDKQDQIRVATALSELSRELTALAAPATITLSLTAGPPPALLIDAEWAGHLPRAAGTVEPAAGEGIAAAARLVDTCAVHRQEHGGTVVLTKRLPPGSVPPTAMRIAEMRDTLRHSRPGSALDALRSQNQDLLQTLEELQVQQQHLVQVNAELEETNRGVMALHAELSDELEQTNRGVVALYAELDEASTKLREASASKTRFWANVSHELRTPLNSVLGLSRLLLDADSEPLSGEQRYQVEMIRDSGAILLALVNELLDVAKAESGRIEAELVATDLAALFDELRAALRPLASTPGVTLTVERPDTSPLVRTDPALLGRIVRNLISNSLKFTERGEVRCRARADVATDSLEIVVSDTGIGIPPEHQRRVFEEFYQVPGRLQVAAGGTGLGLPYARRLAGILGGTLELSSAPGRGTTVTLRLPLGADHYAGSEDQGRFASVLIVDDDPAFRTVLRAAVGGDPERVSEVGDGVGALRALRELRPDLVLLDLHMPAPDGAAVLSEMRQDPQLRDVPVVIVTSADLDPAQRRQLSATAAVLGKNQLTSTVLNAAAQLAAALVGSP